MDWASPLWNYFYLTATVATFCAAYYSQHEYIQKLTLLIGLSFLAFHTFNETQHEVTANYLVDVIGVVYAGRLLVKSSYHDPSSMIIVIISLLDITLHRSWGGLGLIHAIAYNLLYLAQLAVLTTFGLRYGHEARGNPDPRKDLYHRMFTHGLG